ncbi:hypothetical protein MNBD_NITROSPINAE02-1634, partial [hydrothermal vent metagenome]
RESSAKVDFVAVVDADTLQEELIGKKTLVYAACYIGDVRMTDNVTVHQKGKKRQLRIKGG